MAILIDADVIIGGEKGSFDLRGWLLSVGSEDVAIAAVTMAELWHGVERADKNNRPRRIAYLERIVESLPVLAYTEQTALYHARVWAEMEIAGKIIGPYDLIVAATALEREYSLATFNAKHFRRVEGLKVIEPK